MSSTLVITRTCNFTCGHCMMSAGPKAAHMDAKTFEKALTLATGHGIQFFGGEPTLHPLFPQFIRDASEAASNLNLTTNGSTLAHKKILEAISETAHRMGTARFSITVSDSIWHRQFITRKRFNDNIRLLTKRLPEDMRIDINQHTTAQPIGRARLNQRLIPLISCENATPKQQHSCEKPDNPPDIDIDGFAYQCMLQKHTFLGNINSEPPGDIKEKADSMRGSHRKGDSCHTCLNATAPHNIPEPVTPFKGEPYVPHLPILQLFRAARRMANKTIAEMAITMNITPTAMRGFDLHGDRLPNETLLRACGELHINPEFLLKPEDVSPFNLPRNPMAITLKANAIEEIITDLCGATDTPQVYMTVPGNAEHCTAIAWKDKFRNVIVLLPEQPERGYCLLYHKSISSSLKYCIWNTMRSIPEIIFLPITKAKDPFPSPEAAEKYFKAIM